MKRLILVLLTTACMVSAAARPPECVFETYSTIDGLTHDRIADIYTDSKGFVWLCTWYGVSRFDGYTFRNYGTSPGDYSPLSHNRFLTVSEDSNTHLWFTTYNRHVYRFNRFTERFEDVVALLEGVDAKHYRMTHCLHDTRGGTWIAVPGIGIIHFADGCDASLVRVEGVYGDKTFSDGLSGLAIDAHDNVWAASLSGELYRIGAGGGEPQRIWSGRAPVLRLVTCSDRIWWLTPYGVAHCTSEGGSPVELRGGGDLTAAAVDTTGGFFYAGNDRGELFRASASDGALRPVAARGERLGRIRDLVVDSQGTLWITTPRAGIDRFDPRRGDVRHFEQQPYTVSWNIDTLTRVAEGGGRVWIKMNRYGFGYYDREKDSVEPFYNDPQRPECLMTNAVVRFDVHDDVLWLSTYYERGLRKAVLLDQPAEIVPIDSRFGDELSGDLRALLTDSRGDLWVGTKNGELLCYDSLHRLKHRYPEGDTPLGMIYALKEDASGAIWAGTKGHGIYRMTLEQGAWRFKRFTHDSTDEYSLSDDQIYSIEEDRSGRIWIATYGGGINVLESSSSERFIHSGNELKHYPREEADRVRYLLCDAQNRMLAATVDGLLVFDPEQPFRQMRFRIVQKIPGEESSLGNNDIIQLYKDSHGHIWLATFGGGLNRIEGYRNGAPYFLSYDTDDGLPSNICMAITEDRSGDLWVSTTNAVTRFDPQRGLFSNFVLYDNRRTAIFSEAVALTTAQGDVLFGSGKNLCIFDPDRIRAERADYKLRLTGLAVRNRQVPVGEKQPLGVSIVEADRIDLPYNYSSFRVDFASLNFGMQGELNYMYRLEGYDRDWNLSGRSNSAFYSNVPGGDYTFCVKAFAGNVAAADQGRSIRIVIHPPLWLTWWAKMFYALLAGALAILIVRALLSMQRIRRESKLEQDMTDMKLSFFTNISHELRTPLTLILGGIEDVRKHDDLSQRGGISLNLAYKNARRMLTLINQLLDFRKIVKNKMELKISRVNLVPLVEDALDDFREMAAEKHLELLFTVSRRSILVWIDVERMESVVYNLLSNAMKFTRPGGRIEVIISMRDEESVYLTVRDTGIGIPKDKQGMIFERFVQASKAVDTNMKGSGIGLSLCRDIVALHHGEISVESRVGEGAAFTVKLRTGNAHFGMEQIDFDGERAGGGKTQYMVSDYSPSGDERRTDVTPPRDAQKIMLVDDNRELRIFMYNSLIDSYSVIEAEDGIEALEKIRSQMPDIIITDLMMPRMDGIELIDKVRHDFTISHIPIVMLTAKHSPDERVKAMEYGADGYITKPFSIELLLARIDNLLTQRRSLFEKFSSQSARNKIVDLMPEDVVVTDRDEEFMKNVMTWLGENVENSDLTIDQLASHLGMGRTTMYNKLKSLTGKSPVELIKEYRINKAKLLLHTGQFSVSEVAYKVGFSDPGYFSRCFREQFKTSPAEYLKTHNLKQTHERK